jgi:hypothetical protein
MFDEDCSVASLCTLCVLTLRSVRMHSSCHCIRRPTVCRLPIRSLVEMRWNTRTEPSPSCVHFRHFVPIHNFSNGQYHYVCMCLRTYICMYYVWILVRMYVHMHACMYVGMFVRVYVRMYICTYVRMCVCMYACVYPYVWMYLCVCVCMYVCIMCVRVYVCMYLCMCVCMCEGPHVCMYYSRSPLPNWLNLISI